MVDATELSTLVRSLVSDVPEGSFVLDVVEGPDAGQRVEIRGDAPGAVLVGVSPAATLQLTDPKVSRRHLSFEQEARTLRVRDLGSTNGTRVDHVQITDAVLHGGEIVRLGDSALRVSFADQGAGVVVPDASNFGRLLGRSRAMRRLYPLARKLAASRVPAIIEGETGTGKEVLAEAIHEEGPWADKPFVVFDCTAVPATLMEAELFGHERGAFTGAVNQRRGFFEQANGGTLLIDEIGDLELPLQAKLLRAVERGQIRRVGGDKTLTVDVRVLAATRRDLDQEIQAGRFRDDLFHRLAVGRIELPPLRERTGDVRFLAEHMWTKLGGEGTPPPAALTRWEAYAWPGNVRELRNAVGRAVELGDLEPDVRRKPAALPAQAASMDGARGRDFIDEVIEASPTFAQARTQLNEEFERRYLERILAMHGGNVSRAAAASGLARRHFQRLNAKRQNV